MFTIFGTMLKNVASTAVGPLKAIGGPFADWATKKYNATYVSTSLHPLL